ncbi:MAG: ABC transporter permease [Rudaea sp.]|uniref:ABC transporter permease n=1 Tax=Rudaea sp. TaxID=2136325 RepID=UPI0039E2CE7A
MILAEVRSAARGVLRQPGFSVLAIGVLSSGLACAIFMMAMLNGFVVRPLPYLDPDRLLHAGIYDEGYPDFLAPVTGVDLLQIRKQLGGLADVASFGRVAIDLTDIERPYPTDGAYVTANLFAVLGVAPLKGRGITEEDERDEAPVAVVSYELWHARYADDPDIIGRKIRINGQTREVVGVMPKDFSFPTKETIWLPARTSLGSQPGPPSNWIVLRRNETTTQSAIDGELTSWLNHAMEIEPEKFKGKHFGTEPLANLNVTPGMRSTLYLMFTAVMLALLVACANAGNLMVTRVIQRRHELAVRAALGASRSQLIQHLLFEGFLLVTTAVGLAFLIAKLGVVWLLAWFRANDFGPAHWMRFDIDGLALLFVLGAALATAIITSVPPALSASRAAVAGNLHEGAKGVVGTSGSLATLIPLLVVGEVALSCALLICVATMIRGISSLEPESRGVNPENLSTVKVTASQGKYVSLNDVQAFYDRVRDAFSSEANVSSVTVGTIAPGSFYNPTRDVVQVGAPMPDGALPQTHVGAVDDHFLETLGLTLLNGRFFDSRDTATGALVAVVDRRFADRFGGITSVLDRQFQLTPKGQKPSTVTVVGVIAPLSLDVAGEASQPALLVPYRQTPERTARITVRTRIAADSFVPRFTEIMRTLDPEMPAPVRDYASVIRGGILIQSTVAKWFNVLGVVSLILAGAGIYGVTSVSVSRRTREIGVRRALGANNGSLLRSLFSRVMVWLAIGLLIGTAIGVPYARVLSGSLRGIAGADAVVVATIIAVLIASSVLAVALPARRALSVDPMVALRQE